MSASRFVPLLNRILVKKTASVTNKTASGLVLSNVKSAMNTGVVVAVNKGYSNANGVMINPVVSVGETVLIPEFGGAEVKIDNEAFFLYREDDIMGVLGGQ